MELKKKQAYKGYKAYDFLEEGVDYPVFEWPAWDWAGRHIVELNDEQEAMFEEILEKYPNISLHDHPSFHPSFLPEGSKEFLNAYRCGRQFMAYEALAYSKLDCVFDNLADGTNLYSSMKGWKWDDILHDL